MRQVHGRDVGVVQRTAPDGAGPPSTDAIVSTEPGVALVVLTADCVPVLLAGRDLSALAVAHAGRVGVERGVVAATVQALGRLDVTPDELVALVGPAVCGRCYEVPDDMRAAVSSAVPEAFATSADGTASLDLPAAVVAQLTRAGVTDVERVQECTAESDRLFSHRRDVMTGRLAGVVWMPA